jgi:hypothetical protein
MTNREAIYLALLEKLKTAADFQTVGRKAVLPPELQPEQMPALFLVQTRQIAVPQPRGLPARWTLECDLLLYVYNGSTTYEPVGKESVVPVTELNNLLDAVDAALAPDPATGVQTLDGLVSHCWIEGEVQTDEGLLNPQAMALVPVKILVSE